MKVLRTRLGRFPRLWELLIGYQLRLLSEGFDKLYGGCFTIVAKAISECLVKIWMESTNPVMEEIAISYSA